MIMKPKEEKNSKADDIIFGMGIMLIFFFITKAFLMFGIEDNVCDIIFSKDYTVENITESTIKAEPGLIEYEQYGKTRILSVDTYAVICK